MFRPALIGAMSFPFWLMGFVGLFTGRAIVPVRHGEFDRGAEGREAMIICFAVALALTCASIYKNYRDQNADF